jgi:hypothetical protein
MPLWAQVRGGPLIYIRAVLLAVNPAKVDVAARKGAGRFSLGEPAETMWRRGRGDYQIGLSMPIIFEGIGGPPMRCDVNACRR